MTQCTLVECCVRVYRVDGPLSLKLGKKVFPYGNFALSLLQSSSPGVNRSDRIKEAFILRHDRK